MAKLVRSFLSPALAVLALAFASSPQAATITVVSTADTVTSDGLCTFREAIMAANGNAALGGCVAGTEGLDTINFNISGAGVQTISPATPYPAFVEPVTINGYSQPGASFNTSPSASNAVLRIQLDGTAAGTGVTGLTFSKNATDSADGSTVFGLVINNFSRAAISIRCDDVWVAGNYIGTNASGTAGLGAGGALGAVIIEPAAGDTVSGNTIGGTSSAYRNVISGTFVGVSVDASAEGATASGTLIRGNLFGVNAAGNTAIANSNRAIRLVKASNSVIGGSTGTTPGGACTGVCNVIAASPFGIEVIGPPNAGTTIAGNHIGVNAAGTAAIPGGTLSGIIISAQGYGPVTGSLVIGGETTSSRNVMSGWGESAVYVANSGASTASIHILGNHIGTDTTGTVAIPNGLNGVHVYNTPQVFIGGTTSESGNLISGNGEYGVRIQQTTNATVRRNRIGTAANGISPLGNGKGGVVMNGLAGVLNHTIGSFTAGGPDGNVIAHNGALVAHGAGVTFPFGEGIRIFGNSFFSNTGTATANAIDIDSDGPTYPDACDVDAGANARQNSPDLTSIIRNGGSVTMFGTLNSTASSTFDLEFFSSLPNAINAGYRLLGAGSATTNGACEAPINKTLAGPVYAGDHVGATATSPAPTNTSEILLGRRVLGALSAAADFSNDDKSDILWRSFSGANLLWRMDGSAVALGQFMPSVDTGWTLVATGDWNGDGYSDLLWQEVATGRVNLWRMVGNVYAGGVVYAAFPAGWQVAATGDANADGRTDILWRNVTTGANVLWFMNAAGEVGFGRFAPTVSPLWTLVQTGDFNNDNMMDFVWREQSTGRHDVWLMNEHMFLSDTVYAAFPSGWHIVATGDSNMDGNDDIMWRNFSTGANLIWRMNGSSVILGQYTVTVDPAWTLSGTGDFDGDGDSLDMVWRETATGRIDVWLMNGTAFVSDTVYSGNANPPWMLVSPR